MRFWLAALLWRSFCARTFTAALAIALLLTTLGQSQAADPEPKRVLMLHSFGLRFRPWTDYLGSLSRRDEQQSSVRGISGPLAFDCPAKRRQIRRSIRRVSSQPSMRNSRPT